MKSYDNNSGSNSLSSSSWRIFDEGCLEVHFIKKNPGVLPTRPRIMLTSEEVKSADSKAQKMEELKIVELRVGPKGKLLLIDQSNSEFMVSLRNSGVTSGQNEISFAKGISRISIPKQAFSSQEDLEELLKFTVQPSSSKTHSKISYIGEGKAVVLARKVQTGEQVVIKRLPKAKGLYPVSEILSEVDSFQNLSHCRNIVKYLGLYEAKEEVQIIMEYFAETTLTDLVSQKALPENKCRDILRELLEFLTDINKSGYAHRDLKLDNILVAKNANKSYSIRVIDFGYAQDMSVPPEKRLHKYCGTAGFTAPEVIRKEGYSENIDVFAVGCIFYCLLTRRFLFDYTGDWDSTLKINLECNVKESIDKLKKTFSKNTVELLRLMLNEKGKERASACEVLEFLKSNKDFFSFQKSEEPFEESKLSDISSGDFEEEMDEGETAFGFKK